MQMAGERLAQALRRYRKRYAEARVRAERSEIWGEFCRLSGYHRKDAMALLGPQRQIAKSESRRRRGVTYSRAALRVIEAVWSAAGYPWAERLKALLPLWLPWAQRHLHGLTDVVRREVLAISARQMDRRSPCRVAFFGDLAGRKRQLKRHLYGRTKPGTLLRRQVPIQAGPWQVQEPGYAEVDLVAHCGPCARGEFGYSLNRTDVYSGWCVSRAILGRGEAGVVTALEHLRRGLPFALRGLDSDNGSEFINWHLIGYCRAHAITFTRSRPYKKDDNAHIEQKNWTHVRKLFGWERYASPAALAAMNDLYDHELPVLMNLFQPSVKLQQRQRVGTRLTWRYAPARTPLDRLLDYYRGHPLPPAVRALAALRDRTDPFVLADALDRKLPQVARLHDGAAVAPPSTPNGTTNVPMYTSITHAARVFRGDAASGRLAPLSPQRGQPTHPFSLEKCYASR